MILVIAEQRDGVLNRASWEAIAAAQEVAGEESGEAVVALVLGGGVASVAAELAAANIQEVVLLDHAALESYTPDGYVAALQAALADLAPSLVFLPHTYQTRDFAPKLVARIEGPEGATGANARATRARRAWAQGARRRRAARRPHAAPGHVTDRVISRGPRGQGDVAGTGPFARRDDRCRRRARDA